MCAKGPPAVRALYAPLTTGSGSVLTNFLQRFVANTILDSIRSGLFPRQPDEYECKPARANSVTRLQASSYAMSNKQVTSPAALAHVVLRTANIQRMVEFYTTFLGGKVTYGNETIAFITYDEEHHRVALIGIPTSEPKNVNSCGLEHIAFSFNSLASLLQSYRERKTHGMEPVWCINHGPTTSIYYRDPDGNMLETQVDNFETVQEATAFMMSDKFAENPIGTDFDPEEMMDALAKGEDEKVLMKRRDIGPRVLPDLGSM